MQQSELPQGICGEYRSHEKFTAELPVPDAGRGSIFTALPCPKCGEDLSWQTRSTAACTPGLGLTGFLFAYPWTARYHCRRHGVVHEQQLSARLRGVTLARKVLMTAAGVVAVALAVWLISKATYGVTRAFAP